jgi:PAS domain S-box-containing protein
MNTRATLRETHVALLDSQRRVLERIASGAPLQETLETLVRLIEEQAEGIRCAVLLTGPDQKSLRFVAARSVPEDYKVGIEPYLRIGPNMGACGTAAYRREPVYSGDVATDPRWEGFREVALRNGMRAVWSTPILADDGSVLGTFAMYYTKPRLPLPEQIQLIEMAVQMAHVAIEAKRSEEAVRRSDDRLRMLVDAIPAIAWSALPDGSVDFVNDRWLEYTGGTLEDALGWRWTAMIHPDDHARATAAWRAALNSGGPAETELRMRGADGEYRWFLCRHVPVRDDAEKIIRWYGTCTDIQDRKQTEETLRRNQAFFVAEARRIDRLLGAATGSRDASGDAVEDHGAPVPPAAKAAPLAGVARGAVSAVPGRVDERNAIALLTSTERAILRLITDGKSNAEVGVLLHLSPRTVETYRARLMQKLQLDDLVALVKFAIRHGLTSVD